MNKEILFIFLGQNITNFLSRSLTKAEQYHIVVNAHCSKSDDLTHCTKPQKKN